MINTENLTLLGLTLFKPSDTAFSTPARTILGMQDNHNGLTFGVYIEADKIWSFVFPTNNKEAYEIGEHPLRGIRDVERFLLTKNSRPDVKKFLKLYIPSIFTLLPDETINWKSINNNYSRTGKARELDLVGKDIIQVNVTFYDLIYETLKGNMQAKRMLGFLDELFKSLAVKLHLQEIFLLKRTLSNLLNTYDSRFFNYAGELAVLNHILMQDKYTLEKVEVLATAPGVSNVTIDFQLMSKKDPLQKLLAEVVNIHVNELMQDFNEIERFLFVRLSSKMEQKKAGSKAFQLIPVVWGSAEDLKPFVEFFRADRTINIENVSEPLALKIEYNDRITRYTFLELHLLQF